METYRNKSVLKNLNQKKNDKENMEMLVYTKWNDPTTYRRTYEGAEVASLMLEKTFFAKDGDYIERNFVKYDSSASHRRRLLDRIDFAIVENVAVFKYLTLEQLYFLVSASGNNVTKDFLAKKIENMEKSRLVHGYTILNDYEIKGMIYYQLDCKGVALARNRGVMFHKGNSYISYARRQRDNIPYDTPEEVKRVLMGNQIVLGMFRSNAKMQRFGILETFRPVREELITSDGMLRTTVNVKVDEESVLAFEVVRDTEASYLKLANKVNRYYLMLHNREYDYLKGNFHGDAAYPQLIICGESLEHNRKIRAYLIEQGLLHEEDPILFTEDRLHGGDTLEIVYELSDNQQVWYDLPSDKILYITEKKGA